MSSTAIDTAARFGEIPFVEFTRGLISGVFDSLVEAHIEQMEQFAAFASSMTQDLSTYINNTEDGVTFDQISDFVLAYELPSIPSEDLATILGALADPQGVAVHGQQDQPATSETWWGGLINALTPAVMSLIDRIRDPNLLPQLQAIANYNANVAATIPTFTQIHDAVAALIASNKYGLLQNVMRQGALRLVVTEGEIETKLTFSTWDTHESGSSESSTDRVRERTRTKLRGGVIDKFRRAKQNIVSRQLTVNTAKSYQRDTSGTKVDIFGHVLIRFKSDYAPLGG